MDNTAQTFVDAGGIPRTVSLNPLTLEKVQAATGVNLLDLASAQYGPEIAEQLQANPAALAHIISVTAFPADMPESEMAAALASNVVFPSACNALLAALIAYLPNRTRRILKRVMAA